MELCVLMAWFSVGGRVIKCTSRCNCIEGIEKDKMCGAGTVYGRDTQTELWWGDWNESTWET
jgi:hypothetical protein